MAQIELTVCDVCEAPDRGTLHYFITTSDGRRGEADLCQEHGRPIEHLLGDPRERDPLPPPATVKVQPAAKKTTAKKTAAKTATRRRTSLGAKVVGSLDEIEALKGK